MNEAEKQEIEEAKRICKYDSLLEITKKRIKDILSDAVPIIIDAMDSNPQYVVEEYKTTYYIVEQDEVYEEKYDFNTRMAIAFENITQKLLNLNEYLKQGYFIKPTNEYDDSKPKVLVK